MNNIWKIMFDKMRDDDDISPSKLAMRGLVKTIEWGALVIAIAYAGRHAFNMTYTETTAKIEEKNANKEYEEMMKLLKQISLEEGVDLSEKIYQVTSINIEDNQLAQEFNERLQKVETREELQELVLSYLKKYVTQNNKSLREENIEFLDNTVYNKNEPMQLDADARSVIESILMAMPMKEDMTPEEEQEWAQKLLHLVLATEVYEIDKSSSKVLELKLCAEEEKTY